MATTPTSPLAANTAPSNVTPSVAAHLRHFGVPSFRFRILDIPGSRGDTIKEHFKQRLTMTFKSGPLQKGDIAVVDASAVDDVNLKSGEHRRQFKKRKVHEQRKFVMIDEALQDGLAYSGNLLIPATSIWGRAAPAVDMYQTDRLVTFNSAAVRDLIDPSSCTLRFAHDETDCSWLHLDNILKPHKQSLLGARLVGDSIVIGGHKYHKLDCLFLKRKGTTSTLLDIVQLQRIEKDPEGVVSLHLRPFARVLGPPTTNETCEYRCPQHLVLSTASQSFLFDQAKYTLVRRCTVLKTKQIPLPENLAKRDLFWTSSEDYVPCLRCEKKQNRMEFTVDKVMKHSMRTLDLFAGAGGLSIGLALAGNIKTKWAVEMDPQRANALRVTHPHAAIFTGDASDVLKALCKAKGQTSKFPKKGEVDLLVAGPPCQSFSKANSFRDTMDCRSMLIPVTLSWIEALEPEYVIIENVGGIMDNEALKLGDVNQGFPKLIVLTLLSLGYSVRIANVEAAAYGAPQERRRIIFMAAKQGLPRILPPTHIVSRTRASLSRSIKIWGGDSCREYISPAYALHGCAPLPSVTVMDAIDDLPPFDWTDPHVTYPLGSTAVSSLDREKAARLARGIPALEAIRLSKSTGEGSSSVGSMVQRYGSEPRTPYQMLMRDYRKDALLSQHQTSRLTIDNVERVTNILFRPGANYRSWSSPQVKKPLLMPDWLSRSRLPSQIGRDADERYSSEHVYRRLDAHKPFRTSFTTSSPSDRNGSTIHPTQARILTLRESARVQGFPDWITWDCSLEEAQKQIGNAVPVPLARMLGAAVIENVVAVEKKKRELRDRLRNAGGGGGREEEEEPGIPTASKRGRFQPSRSSG